MGFPLKVMVEREVPAELRVPPVCFVRLEKSWAWWEALPKHHQEFLKDLFQCHEWSLEHIHRVHYLTRFI